MPLHHVVLSLLSDGPSYGYELKGAFEEAVGPQWGQLNIGHLYQLLDRLARDGLAVTHRESQAVKPERVVYQLTQDGHAELAQWLASTTPRPGGYRDEFFLKVVAATRTGQRDVLDEVLTTQRGHLMREIHNLTSSSASIAMTRSCRCSSRTPGSTSRPTSTSSSRPRTPCRRR